MKINGIKYTLTTREKNLIETALNDCINVKIIPNEGFEGLIASHNWNNRDYIFSSIHFNTKNGMWDLYEIDGSFDNERKKCSCSSNFVAINNLKKLQNEIFGDAYRKPVLDSSEGVNLRKTY